MTSYTITEPHPTVPAYAITHSGRGGAGNHFRAPQTTSPTGVPTPLEPTVTSSTVSSTSSRRYYSGRGGAGNAHSQIERPTMSFEDEFSRADQRARAEANGHYVGRGGAGNFTNGWSKKLRKGSESSASSSASSTSGKSGFLGRLSATFKH